jgi:hypothetical protein
VKLIDSRHPQFQWNSGEVATALNRESADNLLPLVDDIGYMANFTVHSNLPYRELKDVNEFTRKANNFTLSVIAPRHIGLPYGVLPRIFIPWATTEAVETKSPILRLGRSRSDFMQKLGMTPTGGKNGSINRFTDMMMRISAATFSVSYDKGKSWKFRQTSIVINADFIFDDSEPWNSSVELHPTFFNNAVDRPVPIRWSILNVLRRELKSSLAIDLYIWATYRVFQLERPLPVSFDKLRMQLGAHYADTKQGKYSFQKDVTEMFAKVCGIYQGLRVEVEHGRGVTLLPSPTSVPKGSNGFRLIE